MRIGRKQVGINHSVFIIAEIGINHNGDITLAKELIKAAKNSGADAVKFQKRSVETVYTPDELAKPRKNPFGSTNGDLKRRLEFSFEDYIEIDRYCNEHSIIWFASPWDENSVDFLEQFHVPCHKIASACITDAGLLKRVNATGKPVIMSTCMSEISEIDKAVKLIDKKRLILLHGVSQYPAKTENINLRAMQSLSNLYGVPIGYTGHEIDTLISAVAVGMGACVVERHFTLNRKLWGSDQKSSLEPHEMAVLIENIRTVEQAMGDSIPHCLPVEISVKEKLRRVNSI